MTQNGHAPYLRQMVRRPPPSRFVVPGSTPVIAFGDPRQAEVATLGINPSWREFIDDGRLLTGRSRRLATLESLGTEDLTSLSDDQVDVVINDCARYFDTDRNPFKRWFDPLDRLIREGAGVSFYDGTACHLDLVQWATSPTWGDVADEDQQLLLDEGVPHLREQLQQESIRTVLLNGRQVLDHVQDVGLAALVRVGDLPRGVTTCSLYVGEGDGVRYVGWSTNLQSSWGVTNSFKTRLAAWIGQVISSPQSETRGSR